VFLLGFLGGNTFGRGRCHARRGNQNIFKGGVEKNILREWGGGAPNSPRIFTRFSLEIFVDQKK